MALLGVNAEALDVRHQLGEQRLEQLVRVRVRVRVRVS